MTWLPVIDTYLGGYAKGFDRDKVYEFRRSSDCKVVRFRMSGQHPQFNVANLWFREIAET